MLDQKLNPVGVLSDLPPLQTFAAQLGVRRRISPNVKFSAIPISPFANHKEGSCLTIPISIFYIPFEILMFFMHHCITFCSNERNQKKCLFKISRTPSAPLCLLSWKFLHSLADKVGKYGQLSYSLL